MSRSNWKGPFIDKKNLIKHDSEKSIISRSTLILPKFVEKTFKVHNGKIFNEVNVTDEMIGHKFGEFSFTRKRFSFKKKSK